MLQMEEIVGETPTIEMIQDTEIAKNLLTLGVAKKSVDILLAIAAKKEMTSRDIERFCDYRQPEVSIALRDLTDKNWVKSIEVKHMSKGRPIKMFFLTKDISEIIDDIATDVENEVSQRLKLVSDIRALIIN